jgi:hypothetical protein
MNPPGRRLTREAVSSWMIKATGCNEAKSKAAAALFSGRAWPAMIPGFVAMFVAKGIKRTQGCAGFSLSFAETSLFFRRERSARINS